MDFLIMILQLLSGVISKPLRDLLVKLLVDWETIAKDTPTKWDDMIVSFLKALIGA